MIEHFLACIPFGAAFYGLLYFKPGARWLRPFPDLLLAIIVGMVFIVFLVLLDPTPLILPSTFGVLVGVLIAYAFHLLVSSRRPVEKPCVDVPVSPGDRDDDDQDNETPADT